LLWIPFFNGRFVKESVLGGDVYFGRCCPRGCWLDVVCKIVFYGVYFRVFRLYTALLVCIL